VSCSAWCRRRRTPNYGEFYERRWFVSGAGVDEVVEDGQLGHFRLCREQLFAVGAMQVGIEICEDLWAPEPPGIRHCLAGADLILNLSASNELVAKAEYRRDLVRMTSARGLCGYLYASSGPMESTKDVVFGGHLLAAENGQPLAESGRFALGAQTLVTEFDVERLRHDRMQNTTFGNAPRPAAVPSRQRPVRCRAAGRPQPGRRPRTRSCPTTSPVRRARGGDPAIQATGLARRMLAAASDVLVIGLSGGLDSTLALLVCLDALQLRDASADALHALTMPGPGTTGHTRVSAHQLARRRRGRAAGDLHLGRPSPASRRPGTRGATTTWCSRTPRRASARRSCSTTPTRSAALVVGTGDLSELALGWCTFNADHMASYNVNASVPKTMMAYLVRWYAQHRANPSLAAVLERVLATPISPELLEPEAGRIVQHTETIIGPYELHDFFLFHFVRNGAGP
jgi:NAD+ synthase (glutamine-hydrolysing)